MSAITALRNKQGILKIPIVFGILIALLVLLYFIVQVINHRFPYKPNLEEAVAYELSREGERISNSGLAHPIVFTDLEVTHVVSEVPDTQVVMIAVTRSVGAESERCFSAEYITRHWLSGPRAYSSVGVRCVSPEIEALLPPISIQSKYEKGTYLVAGMTINENVKRVQAHWRDGSETITNVISDTFLLFRPDGVEVEWVVGLDDRDQLLSDTVTYNRDVHFSPLDYTAVQQVPIEGGVVVLGAYSFAGAQVQECIEVTYLTAENAQKFLANEEVFIGQRACMVDPTAEALGPIASTVVGNSKIIGGRALDETIVTIRVLWGDGLGQIVPVMDGGLFLIERSLGAGTVFHVESITGLNAEGETSAP